MATQNAPTVPLGGPGGEAHGAVQRPWQGRARLSSVGAHLEHALAVASIDRGPWLVVAFAAGIGFWFAAPTPIIWLLALLLGICVASCSLLIWRKRSDRVLLRQSLTAIALAFSLGIGVIWLRSTTVGTPPIAYTKIVVLDARVLARENRTAEERFRLNLATLMGNDTRPIKVRVNVPLAKDEPGVSEGARIRLRVRLLPPPSPLVPGAYDFARKAWFDGLAATGSALGDIKVVEAASSGSVFGRLQRALSNHVRRQLSGPSGAIAAAFASGDRGAINKADEDAMRDAGLTHLLSISGLHVSAVIAATYFCAIRLLALWPWLTLRLRLPVVAAVLGALAGVAYTLLTGAQVPTVRSCVGAGLVLVALAMGREPLSLRMVAIAAAVVLLLWPESLVGPSFQMSFAAVIAIVALHSCKPVRQFLAARDEGWLRRALRRVAMLFATGLVIEIVLMPIVLYHFHRSGIYGAFANVLAIPLVTFAAMPLIGLALLFDLIGAGAPFWWLTGKSLELLLGIAHFVSSRPGAVKLVPQMPLWVLLMFVGGGLWLALWRGRARLLGFVPALVAMPAMAIASPPDIQVSRDGRQVGITVSDDRLLVLRDGRSSYTKDSLLELAALDSDPVAIIDWPNAHCNRDSCVLKLERDGRVWWVLMTRSAEMIEWRQLVAACSKVDIVVSDRRLPDACQPRWLKADREYLRKSGGLAVDLKRRKIVSVADEQGAHGWWRTR